MTLAAAMNRRRFVTGFAGTGGALMLSSLMPAWARSGTHGLGSPHATLGGNQIDLTVGHRTVQVGKRKGHAVTVNGTMPGPLVRLKEGQDVRLRVINTLDEDTSIHWHGLILPFDMDGVPGISFPGIRSGEAFDYVFKVQPQAGTYWYHSHSNMQEAMGMFGGLIVDPAGPDPIASDREHMILLSDWSFTHPHQLWHNLKRMGGYYNMQKQTAAGLLGGKDQPARERAMWGRMLMDPTDISDVTGSVYTYLINGQTSADNWTALFTPGERVRLRIVNGSAMTNFNVRIPGLSMTVVAADGLPVQPVEIDEFQMAVAETYDVIVQPKDDSAYAFIAEAIDRSGLCRATLAPRMGMRAAEPALRERPLLTMKDMGMAGMDHGGSAMSGMDHSAMGHDMTAMDHGAMNHSMRDPSVAPQVRMGPGVATLSPMPEDRIGDRPTGLEKVDHRVLTYKQLKSLAPNPDNRRPSREIDVHLTANMERYMWSFDGETYSDKTEPLAFRHNERVRINLVNHTMMPHPIHLHGHFFEVVNGHSGHHPRKNVVNVMPGGKVSLDLTADAPGDWAFHCHMMLHMHSGMFRVVTVRHEDDKA